jgi:hypothetical protein
MSLQEDADFLRQEKIVEAYRWSTSHGLMEISNHEKGRKGGSY